MLVKSTKSFAFPNVAISTYWIVFVLLEDPPPAGLYPPNQTPRVDDEAAAVALLASFKSPKSMESPSDAIVIK